MSTVNNLHVKADYNLCEANGICVGIDPEVFELDDDDNLQILRPQVTPENRPRIQQAVDSCPRAALSIDPGIDPGNEG